MSVLKRFNRHSHGARAVALKIRLHDDGLSIREIAAVELRQGRLTGLEFRAADVFSHKEARQLASFIGDAPVFVWGADGNAMPSEIKLFNAAMMNIDELPLQDAQVTNLHSWAEVLFGEKAAVFDKVLDKYDIHRKDYADDKDSAILDARLAAMMYPKILKDYKNKGATRAIAAIKDRDFPPAA